MDAIYDFETLGTDSYTDVVVSMAVLKFDTKRFKDDPYTLKGLTESARFVKFNTREQIEVYGRLVKKDTLDWWKQQSKEAQAQLKPSSDDVSIKELYNILYNEEQIQQCRYVYNRGPTFDAAFVKSLLAEVGSPPDPRNYWNVADTRSLIRGFLWGTKIRDTFIPEGLEDVFIHHDPRYDVAMDVMRIQYLVRLLGR